MLQLQKEYVKEKEATESSLESGSGGFKACVMLKIEVVDDSDHTAFRGCNLASRSQVTKWD
jgi:hypothetical protein